MDVEHGERPPLEQSQQHPSIAAVAVAITGSTTHLPLEQVLCDNDNHEDAAAAAAVAAAVANDTLPPRARERNREQQHRSPPKCTYVARFRSGPSIRMTIIAVTLAFSVGLGIGLSSCSRLRRCIYCSNDDAARPIHKETAPLSCQPTSIKNASSGGSSGSSSDSNSDTSTTPMSDLEPPLVVEVSSTQSSSSCADHDAALVELRAAAETFGLTFIQQFAYSIRQGGNNSFLLAFADHVDINGWIPNDVAAEETHTTRPNSSGSSRRRRRTLPFEFNDHRELNVSYRPDKRTIQNVPAPRLTNRPQSARHLTMSATTPTTTTAVQEADMVQTDSDSGDIYMAYATTNEVLVIQSATSAIRQRIRIPQRNSHSVVCGILLVSDDTDTATDSLSPSSSLWLVVLIQEVEYATWYGQDNYELESTNTTVLIYDTRHSDLEQSQSQPMQRHSLPGQYNKAYVIGRHIHVVTFDSLELQQLWDYLTPAYLQDNAVSVHDVDPEHAPPLLLNESHYVTLAHDELQRRLDPFVAELAARLHCGSNSATGFVPLLHRPGRNDTNTAMAPADIFYMFHSLDVVVTSVATSTVGNERQSQSRQALQFWNTTSLLLPGASYLTMLVSDTRLVLSCQLWSGASFTTASQPLSYLVAFALVNASVVLSSVGVVPGAVTSVSAMDDTQDYLRVVTTRYDNFVDYNSQMGSDNSNTTSHAQISILDLTAQLDHIMPMVGEWTTDFGHGQVVSSLFAPNGNFVVVAAQVANDSSTAAACALYTIDTTEVDNPRLVGEPLTVPVDTLHLYHINDNGWMIGMSYSYQHVPFDDDTKAPEPFQLFLFNVSTDTSQPLFAARLAHTWQVQPQASYFANGTADLVFHMAQRSGYHYLNNVGLQVLHDSNVIVVPVFSERYYSPLCPPSYKNAMIWTEDTNSTSTHNQSEVPPPAQTRVFRTTCPFEQSIVFDGFWLFEIDVANGTIDKLLEIDHAPYDFVPEPGCPSTDDSSSNNYEFVPPRALGFTGDVLTVKRNAALSHDLLTKAEAAPAIVLQTNCNNDEYNW